MPAHMRARAAMRSVGVPSVLRLACLLPALFAALPIRASGGPQRPFTLAAERGEYLLGEPVYIRIGSAHGYPPSLEEGVYALSVAEGGEGWEGARIYHPPLRLRSAPPDSGSGALAPHSRFARLIASDGGLLFQKPGRYRIRLVSPSPAAGGRGGAGPMALSDSLILDFKAPSAPADKRAFAILSRNPAEYALAVYLEGGDQLREGMAILNELAAFESAYTRMASFILSSDWSQDFTDYSGKPGAGSRPMDLQKALAWAQWDRAHGAYIPLRNAYRLRTGADILAARDPAAPGLTAVRARLASFMASLSPVEAAWIRSFSAPMRSLPAGPG